MIIYMDMDIDIINIDDFYFRNIGIKQIYVSPSLAQFKNRILKKFSLKNYCDINEPSLFFGIYDNNDKKKLLFHKSQKYIIFGGSDVNLISNLNLLDELAKQDVYNIFSISKNIQERLNNMNINSIYINFNLVDNELFKPINKTGNKIYIYNGYSKNQENTYGKNIYTKVIKLLPHFDYIFSNALKVPYEKMPEIYSQCFIGLRLTENDGNANTVQEMVSMNIPIIHNGEQGGIHWENIDDIINIINEKFEKLEKEKYTIIQADLNLNNIDGATIWLTNLINTLNENDKKIIFISNYKINSDFNIKNILDIKKNIIINNSSLQEAKFSIEKMCKLYLIENIIIRSNILLDLIDENWIYLNICNIYALEIHIDNIKKLNNKFKYLLCQTEKIKNIYIENDVYEKKIIITPPIAYKYNFDFDFDKLNNNIKLIYVGTLRNEENIIELIDEFLILEKQINNISFTICYGKIAGDSIFTKKIKDYIKKKYNNIIFKQNLSHKDTCFEIAKSDIGICWRKKNYGILEESTKEKEYKLYGLKICNKSLLEYFTENNII